NGPVNALFSAVDDALQPVLGWHPVLTEYEIKAVSAGEDAQGQVLVRCRRSSDEGPGALVVTGHGLSTNIIEAVGRRFRFGFAWRELTVGGAGIDAYGIACRPEDVDACREADAVLLGAV